VPDWPWAREGQLKTPGLVGGTAAFLAGRAAGLDAGRAAGRFAKFSAGRAAGKAAGLGPGLGPGRPLSSRGPCTVAERASVWCP
jgi:hypothetical protein